MLYKIFLLMRSTRWTRRTTAERENFEDGVGVHHNVPTITVVVVRHILPWPGLLELLKP